MKVFLISPVRDVTSESYQLSKDYVEKLEAKGITVHWPIRDTNQNDKTGFNICVENCKAIREADEVHIIWDGKSQGSMFDLGIVFCWWSIFGTKKIVPVELPLPTEGKSFQNMIMEWSKRNE